MKQVHQQLPAHQPNFAHQLNFAVVEALRGQLNICPGFIDLLDWSNYAGKRSVEHGRIFIPLANVEGAFIVIDKNHTTRYLVERVITTTPERTGRGGPQELGMLSFHGYKFEPNKYLIHGDFHYFEMKSYLSYIGFEEVSLAEQKYHILASEDIYQRDGRGEVLYCKVASRDGDGFEQFYFDRQLKQVLKLHSGESQETAQSNDYFSYYMSEKTTVKLVQGEEVSTLVLNYFFDRLMYGYYSQLWFREPVPYKRIKIFHSHKIVSFFTKPTESLDFSFFRESLLEVYALMRQCVFEEQKLMIFPVCQHRNRHFDLAALVVREDRIDVFEFDPLECESGGWRGRLHLLVDNNKRFLEENGIACNIKAEIQTHSRLSWLSAPRQQAAPDCGIYICLYALLLMDRFGLLSVAEELKRRCRGDFATTELVLFMRRFLYYSFRHRNTYFLPAFQDRFSEAFDYYDSCS